MGLPVRPDVPLFGVISRLTPQKGLDVLAHALDRLLRLDLQMVVLGSGDPEAEHFFASMTARHGDKIRCFIGFDNGLSHRIEAGSDFFLMPSRFEPCGLNQMYSLRYGTLPIVRATGGLVDTVENYDEATGGGTGFVFNDLTVDALANTVGWAVSTFHDRPAAHEGHAQAGHGAGLLAGSAPPPSTSSCTSTPTPGAGNTRFRAETGSGRDRGVSDRGWIVIGQLRCDTRTRSSIVTGGSKGIGAGCVKVFVEDGGSKVVFCSRNEAEGKAFEAEVNRKGPGPGALRARRRVQGRRHQAADRLHRRASSGASTA